MAITSGVCGFCTSHKKIFENLSLLEVQKAFYNPLWKKLLKDGGKMPLSQSMAVNYLSILSSTYRKLSKSLKK